MEFRSERDVNSTLQGQFLHHSWTTQYRMPENESFYGIAFDYLSSVFGAPGDEPVLDAGCGSSTKSIHLAKRGYAVTAVDVSRTVLETAEKEVARRGLDDLITHQCADLTQLPFSDGHFKRVLCWGVLMHIPDVEAAVAELARVTGPGGTIVISEANHRSAEATAARWARKLTGRSDENTQRRPSGIEHWEETSDGTLVTRHADIRWLVQRFAEHGAPLTERRAGQLTELFTRLKSKRARTLLHALNDQWFRRVRLANPAFGNLLVFKKE